MEIIIRKLDLILDLRRQHQRHPQQVIQRRQQRLQQLRQQQRQQLPQHTWFTVLILLVFCHFLAALLLRNLDFDIWWRANEDLTGVKKVYIPVSERQNAVIQAALTRSVRQERLMARVTALRSQISPTTNKPPWKVEVHVLSYHAKITLKQPAPLREEHFEEKDKNIHIVPKKIIHVVGL